MPLTGDRPTFSRGRRFVPEFSGEVILGSVPDDWVTRSKRRVEGGFVVREPRKRSEYSASDIEGEGVRIVAMGYWTATSIRLNDVLIRRMGDDRLSYEVSFRRWTRSAVMWSAALLCVFLVFGVPYYLFVESFLDLVASDPFWTIGGLLTGVFFCVGWPWVLTELHKANTARLLERIIRETLVGAQPSN